MIIVSTDATERLQLDVPREKFIDAFGRMVITGRLRISLELRRTRRWAGRSTPSYPTLGITRRMAISTLRLRTWGSTLI